MDWKGFFPAMLGAFTAVIIAVVVLKTMHYFKKKKDADNKNPGAQNQNWQNMNGYMDPGNGGQQQMQQQPASFNPWNGIPQQNMPMYFSSSAN